MSAYFLADPHFGHRAIIDYENRPFADVHEMDEALIGNWNRVVKKQDTVFLLGDLSFYNNEQTAGIVRRLRGNKHLVLGNHDKPNVQVYYGMGFHRVYDCPIIWQDFWMLSHEPLYVNANMPYANVFGHVHANPQYTDCGAQSFCACVERIGYTPIAFEEVKRRMGLAQ